MRILQCASIFFLANFGLVLAEAKIYYKATFYNKSGQHITATLHEVKAGDDIVLNLVEDKERVRLFTIADHVHQHIDVVFESDYIKFFVYIDGRDSAYRFSRKGMDKGLFDINPELHIVEHKD